MVSPATTSLASLNRFQARKDITGFGQMAVFELGKTVNGPGLRIPFWINPQTYRETSQAIYKDVQASGLPGSAQARRAYFTAHPQVMTLEGTTGTAGWNARGTGGGGMADFARTKPFVHVPEQLTFYYPYMFDGPRHCYVNRFVQETRALDAPLYYYYTIELESYPTTTLPCNTFTGGKKINLTCSQVKKREGSFRSTHMEPPGKPKNSGGGRQQPHSPGQSSDAYTFWLQLLDNLYLRTERENPAALPFVPSPP